MSEKTDKQKRKENLLISSGVGAAISAGTFLATRKPKAVPKTEALRKAKDVYKSTGKVTIVDDFPFEVMPNKLRAVSDKLKTTDGKKNIIDLAWDKGLSAYRNIRYKGVDVVNPSQIKRNTKLKGVVIDASGKNIRGDSTFVNTSARQGKDYDQFVNMDIKAGKAKNLNPYLLESKTLKELGISSKMTDEQIQTALKKKAPNSFIKPKDGERSEGLYAPIEDLAKFKYKGTPGMKLLREGLEKDEFIIQPKLDIKKEYRMHAVGGELSNKATSRHGVPTTKDIDKIKGFDSKEFNKLLQKDLKEKGLDDKNYIIGFDIAKTKDGKFKVIEGNTNSGRSFNFLNPADKKDMLNQITGQKTTLAPALYGVGAAGASAVGTTKLLEKRSAAKKEEPVLSDRQKKLLRNSLIATTSAGVGFGGYKGLKHLLNNREFRKNIAYVDKNYAEKIYDNADRFFRKLGEAKKLTENQKDALIAGGSAAGGIATGAGVYHMLPYTEKEKEINKLVQSTRSTNTGRIPVEPKYLDKILAQDPDGVEFSRKSNKTLGNYLRGKDSRPTFGDDSEIQVLNQNKNRVYAQNVYGDEGTKTVAAKGKRYSIIRDQTAGGIEVQLKPGNADDLYKGVGDAITEGYSKQMKLPKGSKLTNLTYADTTKKGVGLGASSHLHFQAPPEEMDKVIKRVVGATASLNYLVPGAEDRAKGYKSHNASISFGGDVPNARIWANDGEDALTEKSKIGFTSHKKKSWKPQKGNLATEVRFNPAMHGDPNLSKKFFELSELAISGDEKYAKDFEDIGEFIMKKTKGKAGRLYDPEVKKEVTKRFKTIVEGSDFKEDSVLKQMTDAVTNNKRIKLQDAAKVWSKVR